jgi:hypothetical protein
LTGTQLTASILVILLTSIAVTVMVLARGPVRRFAFFVLLGCALVALASWTRNGTFQEFDMEMVGSPQRERQHRPFHFHEFVHYYMGPKYFPETGYLGLYECLALADVEIAGEDGRPQRITGPVRDLAEILIDHPREEAIAQCKAGARTRFSDARWAQFKADFRQLARFGPDGIWNNVVYDAGFNPPPSLVVISHAITNVVPVMSGNFPSYLFVTCIDLVLLVLCFALMRKGIGNSATAVAATFFGATFISDFSWNGGSVLRFTWFVALVLGIMAVRRRRWATAGALLGFAVCDRIFPIAFAAAAMAPIAFQARHSERHRAILKRFGIGFGAVAAVLIFASIAEFGLDSWRVFFARITKHDDVYHPLHIGLKKVLTFRDWVPVKNFHGHDGNDRYRAWNLRLRETWASMRPLVIPLQALIAAATAWVCVKKRRPHEAAVLGGIVFMFCFTLAANYYYCIFALVPAFAFRSAATTTKPERRWRDFTVYVGFASVWTFTLLSWLLPGDDLTRTFRISIVVFFFLLGWIAVWALPFERVAHRFARR